MLPLDVAVVSVARKPGDERPHEPQHGVNREKAEYPDQQPVHEYGGVIVQRIARAIVPVRMGIIVREVGSGPGVTLLTSSEAVLRRNARRRIRNRQYLVRTVT